MKIPFVKPRGYACNFDTAHVKTHGKHSPSRIVLHSTESDGRGLAYGRSIAAYWQRQGLGYGAHFVVSRDGAVINCAPVEDITWHVENRNTGSVGIEQSGYAAMERAEWMRRPSELDATARIIAALAHTWDIPLVINVDHGVATHAMESHHYGGTHTDPGNGYPLTHVLGMARAYVKAGGWRGLWHPLGE